MKIGETDYVPCSRAYIRDYYLVARTSLAPESLATTLGKMIREISPPSPKSPGYPLSP